MKLFFSAIRVAGRHKKALLEPNMTSSKVQTQEISAKWFVKVNYAMIVVCEAVMLNPRRKFLTIF